MNIVDRFYSSFNHDTYCKIRTGNTVLLGGLFIGNLLTPSGILLPFQVVSNILFLLLTMDSSYEYKARDIREIKGLYDEFIINYNKLNKTFSLENPIEIYALFNYLYKNGYLSQEKVFKFGSEETRDYFPIMGSNVFMGTGVCRHLSILLTDILNNYGIPTNYLPCFVGDIDFELEKINTEDFNLDETLDFLMENSYLINVGIDELLKLLIEKEMPLKITLVRSKKGSKTALKHGNHAICFSEYQGLNYFLDPTNHYIYDYKAGKLIDPYGLDIDIKTASKTMDRFGYIPLKEIKEQGCLAKEEQDKLLTKVNNICLDNLDIFEHFYNENKGLYKEATNKLVRIKK